MDLLRMNGGSCWSAEIIYILYKNNVELFSERKRDEKDAAPDLDLRGRGGGEKAVQSSVFQSKRLARALPSKSEDQEGRGGVGLRIKY